MRVRKNTVLDQDETGVTSKKSRLFDKKQSRERLFVK